MSKLPLLEKNAYLSIYVSRDAVYSTLSYSHYEIARSYNIHDRTPIDLSSDKLTQQEFWAEFFNELEQKLEWDFIIPSKAIYSLAQIVSFTDEGEGVSGIAIAVSASIKEK